jgi:hypothetical protein
MDEGCVHQSDARAHFFVSTAETQRCVPALWDAHTPQYGNIRRPDSARECTAHTVADIPCTQCSPAFIVHQVDIFSNPMCAHTSIRFSNLTRNFVYSNIIYRLRYRPRSEQMLSHKWQQSAAQATLGTHFWHSAEYSYTTIARYNIMRFPKCIFFCDVLSGYLHFLEMKSFITWAICSFVNDAPSL